MELNKMKGITNQQYRMSRKLTKMYAPYSDTDKDGVINLLDCKPFNPKEQGIGDWFRKQKESFFPKKKVEPVEKIEPHKLPPVRFVDVGTKDRARVGGITVVGKDVWRGGGGRAPSGRVVRTDFPKEQTKDILAGAGFGEGIAVREKLPLPEPKPEKTQAEIEAEKLGIPTEKYLGSIPSDVLYGEQAPAPAGTLEQYKEPSAWEKMQSKWMGFQLGIAGLGSKYITKPIVTLAPPVPFQKERERQEKEVREKRGMFFGITGAEGELTAGRSVEPEEAEYVKGAVEKQRLAKAEEDRLARDYEIEGKAQVDLMTRQAQQKLDRETTKLQNQVNQGTITVDKANEKLQELADKENVSLEKKVGTLNKNLNKKLGEEFSSNLAPTFAELDKTTKTKAKKEAKKYRTELALATLGTTVAGGFVVGTISALAPPVGAVYTTTYGVKAVSEAPKIVKAFKEYPLASTIQVGGFVGGAVAGGYIGGKLFSSPKISGAIKRANVKTTYKDLTTTKQIKQLKLSESAKAELITQINRGNSIRIVNTRLVARSTADAKFIPDVRGTYIEYLARDGKVIDRIAVGEVVGKFKGKTFSSNVIADAVGKLEGGKINFAGRNLLFQEKGLKYDLITGKVRGGYKGLKYYETLETLKLLKTEKKGQAFRLTGEGEIQIIKTVAKPKVKDVTQILRVGKLTEAQLDKILKGYGKGKVYGKSDIVFTGKMLGGKIKIWKDGQLKTISISRTDIGYGESLFSKIITKAKKTKYKGWDFKAEPDLKPLKYEPTKLTKGEQIISGYKGLQIWEKYFAQQQTAPVYEATTIESALFGVPAWAGRMGLIQGVGSGITTALGGRVDVKEKQIQLRKLRTKQLQQLAQTQQLGFTAVTPRLKVQQLTGQQLKQPQRLKQIQKLTEGIVTPTPVSPVPPIIPPFTPPFQLTFKEETEAEKRRRRKEAKRLRELARKYQASVGAVTLGITAPKVRRKKFTGLELRPVIKKKKRKSIKREKSTYSNKLKKLFKL